MCKSFLLCGPGGGRGGRTILPPPPKEDHCGEVSLDSAGGGEQQLAYTELHNEFSALFENRVEERLFDQTRTEGGLGGLSLSASHVHDALRRMTLAEDESEEQAFIQTLFAIIDYENFMLLVRQTRRGEPWDMESMFSR